MAGPLKDVLNCHQKDPTSLTLLVLLKSLAVKRLCRHMSLKKKERKRKEPSIDLDRKVKCFCCNCDNKFKNNSRASGSQHDRLREYASWSRTSPRGGREQWERINDCTAEPCTMHNIRRALL